MNEQTTQVMTEVLSDGEFTEADRSLTTEWVGAIFGEEEAKYEWATQHWHVLVRCDGRLACHAGITERTASTGGAPVILAGIGGVLTPPEYRRRGFARRAMRAAADFMHTSLKPDFGLLLCSKELVPFYEKLGWKLVHGRLEFDQPCGKLAWEESVMVLACGQSEWPSGAIDLCGTPW